MFGLKGDRSKDVQLIRGGAQGLRRCGGSGCTAIRGLGIGEVGDGKATLTDQNLGPFVRVVGEEDTLNRELSTAEIKKYLHK